MLKFGIISEVDTNKGLARVKFDGEDSIVSYPIPMSMAKTMEDKFIIPYDVNEHVWCIMDEDLVYGVIGGAIYDSKNAPDGGDPNKVRVKFGGGMWVDYERNSKTLSIGGTGDINIDINGTGKGKVNIKCNQAVIDSLTDAEVKAVTLIKLTAPAVLVSGTLQAAAIGIGSAPGTSGAVITGDITVSGKVEGSEVKEGAIRLGTHKHIGVTTGSGTSGTPVP